MLFLLCICFIICLHHSSSFIAINCINYCLNGRNTTFFHVISLDRRIHTNQKANWPFLICYANSFFLFSLQLNIYLFAYKKIQMYFVSTNCKSVAVTYHHFWHQFSFFVATQNLLAHSREFMTIIKCLLSLPYMNMKKRIVIYKSEKIKNKKGNIEKSTHLWVVYLFLIQIHAPIVHIIFSNQRKSVRISFFFIFGCCYYTAFCT